ncbi:MAG: ABC transporter substrate-binding protein [Bacillota bacterium]
MFSLPIFAQDQEIPSELPREETLYLAGELWGPVQSFNPLGSGSWPVITADMDTNLLYEHLFGFNMLTGELDPILATDYNWKDDLTLEVNLNEKAHWSDGEDLTAEDVVYTYKLGDRYNIEWSNIWKFVEDVYSEDEYTVVIEMKEENPNRFVVLDKLAYTWILPEHIISEVEEENDHDIGQIRENWSNDNPVGSGPYKVGTYNSQRVVLVRDENYWGEEEWGKAAPKYVVHPIFKSNESGNRAFKNGDIDISQQFLPQIWDTWEKDDLPVKTWFREEPYHLPYNMPSLYMNHTKEPMSDSAFRRALAHVIDYEKIAQLAMTRYSEPMQPGLLLPSEPQSNYIVEEDVEEYGWKYDPDKAVEILEEAGYTKDSEGWYTTPDGEEIALTATCPHGWTDWNVSLQIMAQNAREIGLNIRTNFPEYPVYLDALQNGDFELTMEMAGPNPTPANPWRKFQMVMDSTDLPEIGDSAYRNYGRYKNEEANEIINDLPKMNDEETAEAFKELNKIFMQDIPIIPLEYRPGYFYEVNETYWKGFPTSEDPYAPPMTPFSQAAIRILFNIEPVE